MDKKIEDSVFFKILKDSKTNIISNKILKEILKFSAKNKDKIFDNGVITQIALLNTLSLSTDDEVNNKIIEYISEIKG